MSLRRLEKCDTGFQHIDVWGSAREVEFRVAGAVHAWWHRERFLTGLAWDNLAAAALLRPAGPPRRILMLGLAGGTSLRVLRHLLPEAELVAVDIDPGIVSLARKHMHLDQLGVSVDLADAYDWLRQHRGAPFDVVVDDVYQALEHDVARPGFYSAETTRALRRTLAKDGLFVVNLVTGAGHRTLQTAFRKFFRSQWPTVRSVTTPGGANEALVGGADVLSRAALAPWRARFPDAVDARYWDVLRVRRL